MVWTGMILGGLGFVIAHRYRYSIDARAARLLRALAARLRALLAPAPSADDDLLLTGRLISSLQGGISLDAALEACFAEASPESPARARLRGILDGRPAPDFLSGFLSTALLTGMPALASLQNLERALRSRRKLALRAVALTGQCRAQAEVLSWLPWVLALAIAFVDPGWFAGATHHALSWLLWAFALLLSGVGRRWITCSLGRALKPRGSAERLEEEVLPDLTLRVLAEVSAGCDLDTAAERALAAMANPALFHAFAEEKPAGKLGRLRGTLRHAARTGAPVREELTAFLDDLQAELESRWEERVQRLPVALLGPLFACFFPSSLLVLAALLLPLLQAGL
jgi:hypothetical protein